jgi:hypothetical protein
MIGDAIAAFHRYRTCRVIGKFSFTDPSVTDDRIGGALQSSTIKNDFTVRALTARRCS